MIRKLVLFISLLQSTFAWSASQGPKFPTAGTDDSSFGTTAWSNPGNITASDNTYATINAANGVDSHYLSGTGFGFAIPSNATITGIKLEIERKGVCTGCVMDKRVRLIKAGTVGSTDKSSGAGWDISEQFITYGGAADLWATTWSAADINDAAFGAVVATNPIASGTTGSVDSFRITIFYSFPQGFEDHDFF